MLNFNLVLVASLFSLPMLILSKIFMTTRKHKMLESTHWICVISMLLWLLIFSIQPHKEERFMYPIYPLICASAALTIKLIEQFVVGTRRPYSSPVFKVIVCICCLAFLSFSLSRVAFIHKGKFRRNPKWYAHILDRIILSNAYWFSIKKNPTILQDSTQPLMSFLISKNLIKMNIGQF